jgi:hypothetical protein
MRSLADQALRCERPGPVRRLLNRALRGAGLGQLEVPDGQL